MADSKIIAPEGLDEFLSEQDPQSAIAAQGLQGAGNAVLGALDEGAMPKRADYAPGAVEPGLQPDSIFNTLQDVAVGAVASKLGPTVTDAIEQGLSHLEYNELMGGVASDFREVAGNRIGSAGPDIKAGFKKPIFTTEQAAEADVAPGLAQKAKVKELLPDSKKPVFTTEDAGVAETKPGAIQKLVKTKGNAEIDDPTLTQDELRFAQRANDIKLLKQGRAKRPKQYAEGGAVVPEGLDAFLSSTPQQPSSMSDVAPPGLDEFIEPEMNQEKYGTTEQQVKAGLEGAAQGLVGPLAPAIERGLGVDEADIRGRAEANPITHGVSEAAGLVGPALASLGASSLARAGLSGAAKALPIAAKFTQLGALEALQAKLGITAGETLASKIGTGAAKAAIDNMLLSGSDETSKMILQDPNQSAQSAIANVGLAGAIGGVLGGGLSGASSLWKSTVGDKTSKLVNDFKARVQEHMDNPNPVDAMSSELNQYHKDVTGVSDEVYGPAGLKAQDIAKSVPEMHEGISNQAQNIYDKLNDTVVKMEKNPSAYPSRLTQKMRADVDQFANKVSTADASPGEMFSAIQDVKQSLQGYAKYDKFVKPVDEAYDFVRDSKSLARGLKESLEDSDVWGNAAKRQKSINEAFSEYLPSLKDFEKKFTSEIGGERAVDPGKISTYLNQLDKPSAELKKEMLENFLNASEKYKKVIERTHANLGLDAPSINSPMNLTLASLEKKTLGSKLADSFIKNGLTNLGSQALGAASGAGIANMLRLNKEMGALIGAHALGPFYKSVLPALANAFLTKEVSPMGVKAAVDYGTAVAKNENLLAKASVNLFKSDAEVLPESMLPSDKDRARLSDMLRRVEKDPELMLNREDHLQGYMPNHASAVNETTANAITYLNSIRPDRSKVLPFDSVPVASKTQQAKFDNALNLAEQPLLVVHKAKQGTLTVADLATVSAIYPGMLDNIRQKLTTAMADHVAAGHIVPYKTRVGLSMLMGQPLDSTMSPQAIQVMQAGQSHTKQDNVDTNAKQDSRQPSGVKSSPALQKMPSMYQTPGQARTLRQNKQ